MLWRFITGITLFLHLLFIPVFSEELEFLPIGLTLEEQNRLDEIGINHIMTSPPTGSIRAIAEWESSTGVIIRWPLGISTALVAAYAEDVMVVTIVGSSSQQNQAINSYNSAGVNMANTEFVIAPTNSIWTRDYGPWFIFDGSDQMAIVDPVYNRPRPQDDLIPSVLGNLWGMDIYGMDLATPGGNHMTDGLGLSMSTELVYDENYWFSPAQIDSIMLAYMGTRYDVLEYIEVGGIHHIDCWAKLLGPGTILIKDVSPSDYNYDLLNQRADYMASKISPWGKPYNVVRIYCPYGTAYTNSLILNGRVYVPTFNSSWDDPALDVYRQAMSGYEILGFDGSWYDDDAIHCRAMGIPDRELLYLEHVPLATTGDSLNDYHVAVKITPHSGIPLISDSLKIYYGSKSQYHSTPLYSTAVADSFYGLIPAQPSGTKISYYLKAADQSGRVETHPYIGEAWAHSFRINQPPEIISEDSLIWGCGLAIEYYPEYTDPDDSVFQVSYENLPGWLTIQSDTLVGTTPELAGNVNFSVTVSDPYSIVTQAVHIVTYFCGDANGDSAANVGDAVFLINYVFKEGSWPEPMQAGDANGDGDANVADAVYLINFVFKSGPPPFCGS